MTHTLRCRTLCLLGLCLATTAGCDTGGRPGLARFETLGISLDEGIQEQRLPSVLSGSVYLAWPQGAEHDCALASRDIEATLNGITLEPIEGVEGTTPGDNASCLSPAFRFVIARYDERGKDGQLTIEVREGDERVRLVAPGFFKVRGVPDTAQWTVPSGASAVLPWAPATDELSRLTSSSSFGLEMTPVPGGLQVTSSQPPINDARLIVTGEVGVRVETCEGIARCSARLPVKQLVDVDVL
ncbi:MAG TPA: hypothetical protein VFO83_14585 [Aggregicoccus sp.]|nr:hypothetical protein [Aggregicoccus sp.]